MKKILPASLVVAAMVPSVASAEGMLGLSSLEFSKWELEVYSKVDFVSEIDYDLDKEDDDDEVSAQTALGFRLRAGPEASYDAVLKAQASRKHFLDRPPGKKRKPWEFAIKEAYVGFDLVGDDSVQLRIGRQDFEDEMEWLFDEELDGLRLMAKAGDWDGEISLTREQVFDRDLLNEDKRDKIDNYLFRVGNEFDSKSRIDGYVLYRDAQPYRNQVEEDLLYMGVQSLGRIAGSKRARYWLNAAYVGGEIEGRLISGYGFDAGFIFTPNARWNPSLVFGFAYGSGDEDDREGRDTNFRQTGLQDNSWRFNGVASFRYLGEALDPELSNLSILTAGVGVKPTKRFSMDLVYHYYRQNKLSDDLRDTHLDMDPSGEDAELGHGIDLVIGFDEISNLQVEFVVGWFLPGRAFDDADPTWTGSLQFKLKM